MKLEIIATSLKDALLIEKGGGDRIELVSAISEGGLTPSIGLINEVCNSVKIPVYVMLRPHSKSFVYDKYDEKVILNDLENIKKTKAKGIVFGALNSNNTIDILLLKEIINNKAHLKLTFHRAIDKSTNPLESLKILKDYDVERVLTSGGKFTAIIGIKTIKEMTEYANNYNIKIMAGSGINKSNLHLFTKYNICHEVHMGSGAKHNSNNNDDIDIDLVKEIKELL